MTTYQGTLTLTITLPVSVDASNREEAEQLLLAQAETARAAGAVAEAKVPDLVSVIHTADDPQAPIPLPCTSDGVLESYRTDRLWLFRNVGETEWHAAQRLDREHKGNWHYRGDDLKGYAYIGSSSDLALLWESAQPKPAKTIRERISQHPGWLDPAEEAAAAFRKEKPRDEVYDPAPHTACMVNEFLRGVWLALSLRGDLAWRGNAWTDARYGWEWAADRMIRLNTPEHLELLTREVDGEIPRMLYHGSIRSLWKGDAPSPQTPTTPEIARSCTASLCLWHALTHNFSAAMERWDIVRDMQPDDTTLARIIGEEAGLRATYGISYRLVADEDQQLALYVDSYRKKLTDNDSWRLKVDQTQILAMTRIILRIPQPDGTIPPAEWPHDTMDAKLNPAWARLLDPEGHTTPDAEPKVTVRSRTDRSERIDMTEEHPPVAAGHRDEGRNLDLFG